MVYLIGGPPRSGKTTLAQNLAIKKGMPYIPVDYLMSVITPYISEDEAKQKLPLRTIRKETNRSNDILYSEYSSEQIVSLYMHEAETFWPGVENFIKYALYDGHDFIIEGNQLLPHFVQSLIDENNREQIRVVYLYKIDTDDILMGLHANVAKNDWAVNNTKEEKTFLAIAEMISLFGSRIKEECDNYGIETVNMDFDFKQKIEKLVQSL